jgi:hypothetical protein
MPAPVLQVACQEHALDQPQEAAIVDLLPQDVEQDAVIQPLEAGDQIPFDEPLRAMPAMLDGP